MSATFVDACGGTIVLRPHRVVASSPRKNRNSATTCCGPFNNKKKTCLPAAFPILFDKIHGIYESHLQVSGRRGPYLHTIGPRKVRTGVVIASRGLCTSRRPVGYILYQLLRLLGKDVQAEEFNTLSGGARSDAHAHPARKNAGPCHHKRHHLVTGV